MSSTLRIGELADEFQLNPGTLRYYESIGLLPAARSTNGYRRYGESARQRLRFISQAKAVGLTLEEIKGVLEVRERGEPPCSHVAQLVHDKLVEVERQLQALTAFRTELMALETQAQRLGECGGVVCGLIERHTAP